MDTTFLSILAFAIITLVYFATSALGKPKLTLDILANTQGELDSYFTNNLKSLGVYLLLIIVSQTVINSMYMVNKCGGATGSNITVAITATIFPWIFIFGIAMATIVMFPGLKSAFTDVIGYFFVSNKANNLLTYILADVQTENYIKDLPSEEQNKLRLASDALIKITSDKSMIINQMVPDNFLQFWQTLEQGNLLKQNISDLQEKKAELFDFVVLKDNVGDATWYFMTALLIISVVSYNLVKKGCKQDVSSIQSGQQQYQAKQKEINKQKEIVNSQIYTLNPKQTPTQINSYNEQTHRNNYTNINQNANNNIINNTKQIQYGNQQIQKTNKQINNTSNSIQHKTSNIVNHPSKSINKSINNKKNPFSKIGKLKK